MCSLPSVPTLRALETVPNKCILRFVIPRAMEIGVARFAIPLRLAAEPMGLEMIVGRVILKT